MDLQAKDIRAIAELARLAVSDDECRHYAGELSAVFDLVAQMGQGDQRLAGVEPLAHPLDMTQRLREDRAEPADAARRDRLQAGAPALDDGRFLVPRVIE